MWLYLSRSTEAYFCASLFKIRDKWDMWVNSFVMSNLYRISVYGTQIRMKSGTMDPIVLLSFRLPPQTLEAISLVPL